MTNRRVFLKSCGSGVALAAFNNKLFAQSISETSTTYRYAHAAKVWNDDLDSPLSGVATNLHWFEEERIAEYMFQRRLSEIEDVLDRNDHQFVRMLAQGEYDLPPSEHTPRFDSLGIRTSPEEDFANGVFVFSLCGNLMSDHVTVTSAESDDWRSPADDLIYSTLSRMVPFDGPVNRESMMDILPQREEATELGLPIMGSESYTERQNNRPRGL